MNDTPSNGQNNASGAQPQMVINAHYIKDLSFENPNSPKSLMPPKDRPKSDLGFNMKANKIGDNTFEVQMHIEVKVTSGELSMFMVDLTYAGVFTITGLPQDKMEEVLMVDCPNIIYPFARRVVADLTRDGGFPPILLDPIDFRAMFVSRKMAA